MLLDSTENMIPKPDTDAVITRGEIFSFLKIKSAKPNLINIMIDFIADPGYNHQK